MKSTNLQFSQRYIFVGFVNKADIVVDYDKKTRSKFLLTPTRITLNAGFIKKCDFRMTRPTYVWAFAANSEQEAQLPQRNSASAAHMEGGWG